MPSQVYRCLNPKHGEFQTTLKLDQGVPGYWPCPKCGERSVWVPSIPNFIGGPTTGAGNK